MQQDEVQDDKQEKLFTQGVQIGQHLLNVPWPWPWAVVKPLFMLRYQSCSYSLHLLVASCRVLTVWPRRCTTRVFTAISTSIARAALAGGGGTSAMSTAPAFLLAVVAVVVIVVVPPATPVVEAFGIVPRPTSSGCRACSAPCHRSARICLPLARTSGIRGRYSPVVSPPARMMCSGGFNQAEIAEHLEHDYKADLAKLAQKFGTMIESIDDIEEVHVSEIDGCLINRNCNVTWQYWFRAPFEPGLTLMPASAEDSDHMSLEVVYCDSGEQTCVAIAVPIKFPYHCDDERCIIHAIHDLEEMEDVEVSNEVELPKRAVSPELMETIARIAVVMNRDFQEELVNFIRAFGGPGGSRPTGQCEMISLTPDGFVVQAAMFPEEPVTVTFPRECISAADFQQQILALSEQAISIAAL